MSAFSPFCPLGRIHSGVSIAIHTVDDLMSKIRVEKSQTGQSTECTARSLPLCRLGRESPVSAANGRWPSQHKRGFF